MPTFDHMTVVETRPQGPGTLWLRFNDGAEGIVDLAPHFPPRFEELKEADYFARVQLGGGGVQWPNGFDCAPDWLRARAALSRAGVHRNDDGWEAVHRNVGDMPEISRFFGIVIRMFYSDHARPHFHAECGEYLISVEIDGAGVHGRFPPSRLPMLFDWRDQHRDELLANWERLQRGEAPVPVAPLK